MRTCAFIYSDDNEDIASIKEMCRNVWFSTFFSERSADVIFFWYLSRLRRSEVRATTLTLHVKKHRLDTIQINCNQNRCLVQLAKFDLE